ncbi:uncharacterized protein ACA1_388730 [Acanthamoeba castellanii str. Neff]|uniref:Uncharacterized protein n=1 Tax=Acanthamoeba castellanii (strain ATCC 30010 / Neff) TaxID=1257118 RepID=L8GEN8_ACACF|nr:uncharacterized protein ACA1_388730 [Acanthamoeba castellanii str. Neff]ELR11183.1 hypothetical protein ACA1_388730 [Acanthamoeba castellanii str. Neff]
MRFVSIDQMAHWVYWWYMVIVLAFLGPARLTDKDNADFKALLNPDIFCLIKISAIGMERILRPFMSALPAAEKVTGYVGRLEKLVELTLALYTSPATMITFFSNNAALQPHRLTTSDLTKKIKQLAPKWGTHVASISSSDLRFTPFLANSSPWSALVPPDRASPPSSARPTSISSSSFGLCLSPDASYPTPALLKDPKSPTPFTITKSTGPRTLQIVIPENPPHKTAHRFLLWMQLYTAAMLVTFEKLDSKYLMAGEYAQDPFVCDLVLPVTTRPIERVFGETGEHLKESNNNIHAAILSTRVARNEYPNDSTMMEGYMNAFPNITQEARTELQRAMKRKEMDAIAESRFTEEARQEREKAARRSALEAENAAVTAVMAQHGSALAQQSVTCGTMKAFLQERRKSGWVMLQPPTLPVLSKMKHTDLINAIRMLAAAPCDTITLPTSVSEPDDGDDTPLSTATSRGGGDDREEVDEDGRTKRARGSHIDVAAYDVFTDAALLEVAAEETAKAAADAEKATLATNAEHGALSAPLLSPAPTWTSVSVASFLAQHNVGVGLAWVHRPPPC